MTTQVVVANYFFACAGGSFSLVIPLANTGSYFSSLICLTLLLNYDEQSKCLLQLEAAAAKLAALSRYVRKCSVHPLSQRTP